jgi:hypothetical protein
VGSNPISSTKLPFVQSRTPPRRCYPGYVGEPAKLGLLLRRATPYLSALLLAAVAYDAWVFYSRWSSSRQAQRAEQAREAEDARKTLDALGGGGLKILTFYAAPGAIRRGDHASLCYGVTGAQNVRLEPAIAALHPALSYCLQVAPEKNTEYKLIAEDAAGHTATATVTIQVVR